MPWSGGVYTRGYPSWTNDANNNLPISATKFDTEDNDFAAGLNNCITKDGLSKPTSAMDWNGQNLTGINNLTVNGTITFSSTGVSSWAGSYTFTKAITTGGNSPDSPIIVKSTTPAISLVNSGAPANQQAWTLFLGNADLIWRLDNDAASSNKTFLDVNRSTNTVVSMSFGNATDNPAYNFLGSGLLKAGDQSGNQLDVGWRDCPQNAQTINYQLVLADRGKQVMMTGAGLTLTIPANASVAFPIGTTILIFANANALTIAITTDTLVLAGVGTTGSRTLAAYGLATLTKYAAQNWVIGGSGVS